MSKPMEPVERVSALSVKSHTVFCTVVHQYRQPPGAAMPRQHPGLHLADMSHLAQSRHTSTSISETLTTLPACSLTFQAPQIFSTDCDSPHSFWRKEQFGGAVPKNSTLLCPRFWISAPMDTLSTRRANDSQFSNSQELWIHQTTGNFRKMLRKGRGTPRCWNSLTRYQTDRVGL